MPVKQVQVNNLLNRTRNITNDLDLCATGNGFINHNRYYNFLLDYVPNRLQIEVVDLNLKRNL